MKQLFTFCLTAFLGSLFAQAPRLQLSLYASGFNSPIEMTHCGDDRLFVIEQSGYIRIIQNGTTLSTPFLNIDPRVNSAGNEQGLLGLAFHPEYKQNGYFYVNYTTGTGAGSTRISRFSVLATDSNQADPNSELILLTFTQPFSNHNGGSIHFGPDGYLYISTGDGGSANDPQGNGQNKNTYLGKMLRLDVDAAAPYIPASNPFVGQTNVKEEIWAYGLRNAWKFSFDKINGNCWMADVGQNMYEEINFQPATSAGGENYGWRCYEGNNTFNATGCASSGFTAPVYVYSHTSGNCSVTGGYVYRGAQHQNLFGKYLFTDYCSGTIWATFPGTGGSWQTNALGTFLLNQYASFGQDKNGELYIAGRANGNIYTIRDTSSCNPVAWFTDQDTLKACGSSLDLQAVSGTGLSYEWLFNGNPAGSQPSITAGQSGTYQLNVRKNASCLASSNPVTVLLNQSSPVQILNLDTQYCNSASPVILQANVSGGAFTIDGQASSAFDPGTLSAGPHEVIFSYTNDASCVSTQSLLVNVQDCSSSAGLSNLDFSLYPNPASDLITISMPGNRSQVQVRVADMYGRIIQQSESKDQQLRLNVSDFPVGTYVIRLTNGEGSVSKSILIQ